MLRDYGYPKRRKVKYQSVTWREHPDGWTWVRKAKVERTEVKDWRKRLDLMR